MFKTTFIHNSAYLLLKYVIYSFVMFFSASDLYQIVLSFALILLICKIFEDVHIFSTLTLLDNVHSVEF